MKKVLLFIAVIALSVTSCKKDCHQTTPPSTVTTKIEVALSLPPGCTSTTGYSTSNGQSCNLNSPGAGIVLVSSTSSTNGIKIFAFTVRATGTDAVLRKIPIQFTSTGAPVASMINSVKIYQGNDLVDVVDGSNTYLVSGGVITANSGAGSNTVGYIFSNISAPYNIVKKDLTFEYKVVVDVKASSGNYPSGSTLVASFTNADLLSNNFSAIDVNGDLVPANSSHRVGSANGEVQTLSLSNTIVTMGIPTYTNIVDMGNVTQVTYNIPFTILSNGGTLFLGQTANYGSTVTGTNAFAFTMNNSTQPSTDNNACVVASALSSSDAIIQGNGYRLDQGASKHFTLTVVLVTPSPGNSSYRVFTKQIKTFTDPNLITGALVTDLLPSQSFQTLYQFITN